MELGKIREGQEVEGALGSKATEEDTERVHSHLRRSFMGIKAKTQSSCGCSLLQWLPSLSMVQVMPPFLTILLAAQIARGSKLECHFDSL